MGTALTAALREIPARATGFEAKAAIPDSTSAAILPCLPLRTSA